MVPPSHKDHADLLARAHHVISASGQSAEGLHQGLLAELVAAQQAFAVSPSPWAITLCVGIVEHRQGLNLHVAYERSALDRELAAHCREWWSETGDGRDPVTMSDGAVIECYFSDHHRESLTVETATLEPPSPEPSTASDPERGRYCVLSTAHLTAVTGDLLDVWASWPPGERPLDIAAAVHGWFVPTRAVAQERAAHIPEDLTALMQFGRDRAFDYVLVDCDGDEVASLKVHSW